MSGVIALIPCHLASLRICRPVSVAATPSMALNFRRSFAALAGRAALTAVTASPTAAERVPRPPCTTTRKVASGCAAAASSRLCGTIALLLSAAPASANVPAGVAEAIGTVSARTTSMLASVEMTVRADAERKGSFCTVRSSLLRRRRIFPKNQAKARSGLKLSPALSLTLGTDTRGDPPPYGGGEIARMPTRGAGRLTPRSGVRHRCCNRHGRFVREKQCLR